MGDEGDEGDEGEGRRRKEKEGGARKEMETRNEGTRHEHDTEE